MEKKFTCIHFFCLYFKCVNCVVMHDTHVKNLYCMGITCVTYRSNTEVAPVPDVENHSHV